MWSRYIYASPLCSCLFDLEGQRSLSRSHNSVIDGNGEVDQFTFTISDDTAHSKNLFDYDFSASNQSENLLVKLGIMDETVADIFSIPTDPIPSGRKRPLRQASRARTTTSDDVARDLEEQKKKM